MYLYKCIFSNKTIKRERKWVMMKNSVMSHFTFSLSLSGSGLQREQPILSFASHLTKASLPLVPEKRYHHRLSQCLHTCNLCPIAYNKGHRGALWSTLGCTQYTHHTSFFSCDKLAVDRTACYGHLWRWSCTAWLLEPGLWPVRPRGTPHLAVW